MLADLASTADYYPGGMMMPGRNTEHDWSRMGAQGQQKDDEVARAKYRTRLE